MAWDPSCSASGEWAGLVSSLGVSPPSIQGALSECTGSTLLPRVHQILGAPIFHYKGCLAECSEYRSDCETQPALYPGNPALNAITCPLYTGDTPGTLNTHTSTPAFKRTAWWLMLKRPCTTVSTPHPYLCPIWTQVTSLALKPPCLALPAPRRLCQPAALPVVQGTTPGQQASLPYVVWGKVPGFQWPW